jgi:hypothetical protein
MVALLLRLSQDNDTILIFQVYRFEKGDIKPANQRFNSTKHQYEIAFNRSTEIEEVRRRILSGVDVTLLVLLAQRSGLVCCKRIFSIRCFGII